MRFIKTVLPVIALTVFISAPLHAQHITGLEIEDLFRKTEEAYTSPKPNMDEIIEQTLHHTVQEAIVKQEIKSNKGPRIIHERLTRDQVVAGMRGQSGNLFDSSLRRTIMNIEYSEDKKNATVEYTALFKARVKSAEDSLAAKGFNGEVFITFKSLSVCSEKFKLQNDILKSYGADCKTEILYGETTPVKQD